MSLHHYPCGQTSFHSIVLFVPFSITYVFFSSLQLHEESDNFLFDGQAPEPVLDTFSDINRWTALRHLLLALTVFTSPLWLQKLLLDEHETPAIMPLADKEEFNTSNPMPSRQARVFHV